MSARERIDQLMAEFSAIELWEERYKRLIEKGKALAPLPEEHRTEANKVKGCQSQVWLWAEFNGESIHFVADSDASIVKGIIAILLEVYSGLDPDEILSTPTSFLDEIGLRQHLSMNRSNGLSAMLKQIQLYAFAFKTKREMESSK